MLIPKPAVRTPADGAFVLDGETRITAVPELADAAYWLHGALSPATGFPLLPEFSDQVALPDPNEVRMELDTQVCDEAYHLRIRPHGVRITAGGSAGAFYAAQTFRSLLPAQVFRAAPTGSPVWSVDCLDIEDQPRFGWRGCLLDVARHFMPKASVLRFVDLLAMHKLNVLHLHLTDDQGWRLQIRRFPRLTEVGASRRESPLGHVRHGRADARPHGGYYTQDDIREIVAYAAARHVTVVPEIDVPGHSQAAIASYPELGAGRSTVEVSTVWGIHDGALNLTESTLDFYRQVLDEVLELFPSRHICLGGDEVATTAWEQDPGTQLRMATLGLADERAARTWLVGQLGGYLAERGRRLLGWDEILDGELAPEAMVLSWRGTAGGVAAAERGHDVVMCPSSAVYLDHRQSDDPGEPTPVGPVLGLADVYAYEPVPAELDAAAASHVLGAQCCVWTEYMDSPRAVDYMVFPRLCAFAEAVWSGGDRDLAEFTDRLRAHERRLDALGVEYRPSSGPHPWQTRPDAPGWPLTADT